jgi:NTP pyrophosphatase (non-canonical NTP hydrolase)
MDDAQRERLTMLIEECGEVIQAATKALRHGYESRHPDGRETNREYLARELRDLDAVLEAMANEEDVVLLPTAGVWERKLRFTHHQVQP